RTVGTSRGTPRGWEGGGGRKAGRSGESYESAQGHARTREAWSRPRWYNGAGGIEAGKTVAGEDERVAVSGLVWGADAGLSGASVAGARGRAGQRETVHRQGGQGHRLLRGPGPAQGQAQAGPVCAGGGEGLSGPGLRPRRGLGSRRQELPRR